MYEALEFIMTRTNITSNEEYDEILKNVGVLVSKINQYYESPTGAQLRNSDVRFYNIRLRKYILNLAKNKG